jgi:hypothetical protein
LVTVVTLIALTSRFCGITATLDGSDVHVMLTYRYLWYC